MGFPVIASDRHMLERATGASGLTFKSISSGNNTAAGDPANGIVLSSTGASGSLIVTGDGNASVGGNSSGGTIQPRERARLRIPRAKDDVVVGIQNNGAAID